MRGERVITAGGERIAIHIPASSWEKGLSFFSDGSDFVQVGVWRYERGRKLQPHVHNEVRREATHTQEVVFVRSGRVAASIFSESGNLIERVELAAGDILVLLKGGHGYEILEEDTQVLEVKNGPYPGPEADRRRMTWPIP